MSDYYKVLVIGEVSSGKSSVVNSMAGGLISNSSLQRETLNLISFDFVPGASEDNIRLVTSDLEKVHKMNEEKRADIMKIKISDLNEIIKCEHPLPSRYGLGKYTIVDFPGINDTDDVQDLFMKVFENKLPEANVVVYVTDASKAFISSSEVKNFKKIKNIIEKHNTTGKYIDLMVLVNKFDDVNDTALNEIFNKIPTKIGQIKTIKYSSHRTLIECIIDHKLAMYIPKTKSNYLQREIIKILKNANVMQTSSLIDSIKNKSILSHADILLGNNINWGDELFNEDSEEDINNSVQTPKTNMFFNHLESSRTENISKQLASFNIYYTDLIEKMMNKSTDNEIIEYWNKIKFDEINLDKLKKKIICDIFISKFNRFVADHQRIKNNSLLCYVFDYAISINSEELLVKIITIVSEAFETISRTINRYIFYQYITNNVTNNVISLTFDEKIINWFRHIFSTTMTIYDSKFELKMYNIEKKSFVDMSSLYNDGASWYINDLIHNTFTPELIKHMLKLTKYDINAIYYMDDIGRLEYLLENTKGEELLKSMFRDMISNIKWIRISGVCVRDMIPTFLFGRYSMSDHKNVVLKIMSDFPTNGDKVETVTYHKSQISTKAKFVDSDTKSESSELDSSSEALYEVKKKAVKPSKKYDYTDESQWPFDGYANFIIARSAKIREHSPMIDELTLKKLIFIEWNQMKKLHADKSSDESEEDSENQSKKSVSKDQPYLAKKMKPIKLDSDESEEQEQEQEEKPKYITEYQKFVSEKMKKIKEENPNIKNTEVLRLCALAWRTQQERGNKKTKSDSGSGDDIPNKKIEKINNYSSSEDISAPAPKSGFRKKLVDSSEEKKTMVNKKPNIKASKIDSDSDSEDDLPKSIKNKSTMLKSSLKTRAQQNEGIPGATFNKLYLDQLKKIKKQNIEKKAPKKRYDSSDDEETSDDSY